MGQPRKSDLDALLAPFEAGEHEHAASTARRFARRWPAHPAGWATLGKSLYRLGELDDAERALDEALRLDPASAPLHNDLGLVLLHAGRPADAEAWLRTGLEIDPDHAGLLSNCAAALNALGRPGEAERLLRRALITRPDDPQLVEGLAGALRDQLRFAEAAKHFRRAASLQPGATRPQIELGRMLRELGRHDDAERAFRRAAERAPQTPAVHVNLGVMLADRGRREEALAAYRRAAELDPGLVAARTGILATKSLEPDDPDIAALAEILEYADLAERERARAHYALGDALARLRADPDAEWRHFRAGAALRRREFDYDRGAREQHVRRLQAIFTDAPAAPAEADLPAARPLFVVGMPRSGTTLVEQILAAHPAVDTAGERADAQRLVEAAATELGTTYPEGFDALDDAALRRMASDYRRNVLDACPGARWVIDKQPDNHRHVGLLAQALPEAVFLEVRREPADTCVSCFARDFVAPWSGYTHDLAELGHYYRLYAELMEHWRAILSTRMLAVQYEAVVADLQGTMAPVLAALGLDWDPACAEFHRAGRAVATSSKFQVRQPLYSHSIGHWRRYARHLGPLLEALGPLAPADADGASSPDGGPDPTERGARGSA